MRKSFLVPTLSVFIVGIVLGIADPSVWIDPSLRTNTIGPTIVRVSLTTTGAITAGSFIGDGSLLTGVTGGGGLSSSDPGVFSTNNSKLYVKSGAGFTNAHFSGSDVTFPVGQRFDTVVVTNALGVRDSDGVSTYQLNNVSGDFLFSGPGTTLMTYTQSVGKVYVKNPIHAESTVTASQFIGDGSLLTGVSGAGIPTASGKGTGIVLRTSVVGISNASPSTLAVIDANTNVGSSGISISGNTNLYGLGSYTGVTAYVRSVFANISPTNATASRAAIIGADNIISNSTVTAAELAFMSGATGSVQTQINANKALLDNAVITNSSGITSTGTVAAINFVGSSIDLTNSASPGAVNVKTTNGNPIVINGAPQALSYTGSGAAGSNVMVNATNGHVFVLTMTNNVFMDATNMAVGQQLGVILVQGAPGDWKLAFNTNHIRTNSVDGYTVVTNVGGQTYVSLVVGAYGTNAAAGVRKMF